MFSSGVLAVMTRSAAIEAYITEQILRALALGPDKKRNVLNKDFTTSEVKRAAITKSIPNLSNFREISIKDRG